MKKFLVLIIELIVFSFYTWGQTRVNYRLPDIPGYITLKGDFHMHTPFSDGTVWPDGQGYGSLERWFGCNCNYRSPRI